MWHPSYFEETYYIFPCIVNNDLQGIIVQIKFDVESLINLSKVPSVEVTLKIMNQKDDFDKYIISKDSSLFIPQSKFKKYCPSNFHRCSLTIEIIKKDENTNDYKILTNVHSYYQSVEYVLKNKVYTYSLRPIDTKYFYTQIDKNEKGEISFMFNKGNGEVYAKLVEKDNFESFYNWNKRIRLPDSASEDLLNYDYLNNVLKYDAKDKNGCPNGCELYFLIESTEVYGDNPALTEVSFSIDKKWTEAENGINEIPLNKYVKGVVDYSSNYKYYTITIPEDFQKISFNLYSLYTKAFIKLGKNHYCKKDNKLWEIKPEEGFGRIIIEAKDKSIGKDSLKGVSFSIGIIKNDELNFLGNENLFYYLEVQGLYNNNKPYYQLNSERSIICETGSDYYCHALLYINKIYNIGKGLVYSLPLNNDNISIYAQFYNGDDIEKKTYKDSIQNLFPTKESNYQQKSEENYLFLNYEKLDKFKDVYILLTIYSKQKNSKIKLIISGVESARTLLPYNTEKLINLKENIGFYMPSNFKEKSVEKYLTNIRTIKGTPKLIMNDTEIYKELNGNYYVEIDSHPYTKAFDIEYIENKEQKDQGMLISFEKAKRDKLFKIEKNIINEIYINGNNYFPHYVYIPLIFNSSMMIEYSFYDLVHNTQKGDDTFKISGMVISDKELNKRIKNPEEKIEGEIISGNYSLSEKKGIIFLNKAKIKNDNDYYLLMTIDKESDNKNDYKSLKVKYIPSLKEGEKEDDEKEEPKEPSEIELPNLILVISFYIAGILLIIPLIVFICVKINKKKGVITIDNNDINESIGINNDSLIPNDKNN